MTAAGPHDPVPANSGSMPTCVYFNRCIVDAIIRPLQVKAEAK